MAPAARGGLCLGGLRARAGAARFGGTVRAYFAEALRQAWAEAKARLAEDRFALTVTGLLVLREAGDPLELALA